jgi:uncharacterized membrane protein required for colicin V production
VNGVDILFILILVSIMALGFFKGMIKLTIAMVAFYLGIVLASLYFRFFAGVLFSRNTTSQVVSDMLSFLIILFLAFFLLLAGGLYTFRYLRMPGKLEFINKVIGIGFGVLFGAMIVGILAMVFRYMFITNDTAATVTWPLMRSIQGATRNSTLVKFFVESVVPTLHLLVSPILPQDADIIFKGPLTQ